MNKLLNISFIWWIVSEIAQSLYDVDLTNTETSSVFAYYVLYFYFQIEKNWDWIQWIYTE